MDLCTICGIFLNLYLVTSCLLTTSICFIFLLLFKFVRYFYANICAIFYLSIDMLLPIFVVVFGAWGIVGGFIVAVGAAIGVVVGVGLVGYLHNFFLSINIIQRIMIMQHTQPISNYKLKDIKTKYTLLK